MKYRQHKSKVSVLTTVTLKAHNCWNLFRKVELFDMIIWFFTCINASLLKFSVQKAFNAFQLGNFKYLLTYF